MRRLMMYNSKYFNYIKLELQTLINSYQYGDDYVKSRINHIANPFWRDVFQAFMKLCNQKPRNWEEFCSLPLWYNSMFKIGGRSYFYQSLHRKGIYLVNDLLDINGNFLSYDEASRKYSIQTNFLNYQSIVQSVKAFLNTTQFQQNKKQLNPLQPLAIRMLFMQKKGCRMIYDFIKNPENIIKSKRKWITELNLANNFDWEKLYSLPFNVTEASMVPV